MNPPDHHERKDVIKRVPATESWSAGIHKHTAFGWRPRSLLLEEIKRQCLVTVLVFVVQWHRKVGTLEDRANVRRELRAIDPLQCRCGSGIESRHCDAMNRNAEKCSNERVSFHVESVKR
jgi:hypothetical protein